MIPFSVLDLAPIVEGGDARQALRNSVDLAQTAERTGYLRFWLAEHHNLPGIASAATAVLIGHVAQATRTMRIGAGGIMLPNHAPLLIAEQFGTLETLYPGRIDLGLGRAPGGDPLTAQALRRTLVGGEDRFPNDVLELQALLGPAEEGQKIHAVPGADTNVPLWILGSSTFGAQLAAQLGLPYAFASHFAPQQMMDALAIYRATFRPSAQLSAPYVMLGFNMFAAPTDAEGRFLATSLIQAFAAMRSGRPTKLQPPNAAFEGELTEMAQAPTALSTAFGSPDTVRKALKSFIDATGADELMLASHIFDHDARKRSYEIAAEVRASMA